MRLFKFIFLECHKSPSFSRIDVQFVCRLRRRLRKLHPLPASQSDFWGPPVHMSADPTLSPARVASTPQLHSHDGQLRLRMKINCCHSWRRRHQQKAKSEAEAQTSHWEKKLFLNIITTALKHFQMYLYLFTIISKLLLLKDTCQIILKSRFLDLKIIQNYFWIVLKYYLFIYKVHGYLFSYLIIAKPLLCVILTLRLAHIIWIKWKVKAYFWIIIWIKWKVKSNFSECWSPTAIRTAASSALQIASGKLQVASGRQWGAYRLDLWTALVGRVSRDKSIKCTLHLYVQMAVGRFAYLRKFFTHANGVGLSLCHRRAAQETAFKSLLCSERWSQSAKRPVPKLPSSLDQVWGHFSEAFRLFWRAGWREVLKWPCGLTQRHIICVNCISYYQVPGERFESFVTAGGLGFLSGHTSDRLLSQTAI